MTVTIDHAPRLAVRIAVRIARDLAARGARAWTMAVPGGSVAASVLPHLARQPLPWTACDVVFADERRVDAGDDASNWRACRTATAGTAMDDARWHRLPADLAEPGEVVRRYAATLREVAGDPPVLDVVILGVGQDGHVASLFPGHVHDAPGGVLFDGAAPKPPAARFSLAMDVLVRARLACVVALGAAKRDIVRDAVSGGAGLPVTALLHASAAPWLLADPEAAGDTAADG
ncbi:MAG: 6-phosphogluconolactonase [Vicinamibacterales bacterium]